MEWHFSYFWILSFDFYFYFYVLTILYYAFSFIFSFRIWLIWFDERCCYNRISDSPRTHTMELYVHPVNVGLRSQLISCHYAQFSMFELDEFNSTCYVFITQNITYFFICISNYPANTQLPDWESQMKFVGHLEWALQPRAEKETGIYE